MDSDEQKEKQPSNLRERSITDVTIDELLTGELLAAVPPGIGSVRAAVEAEPTDPDRGDGATPAETQPSPDSLVSSQTPVVSQQAGQPTSTVYQVPRATQPRSVTADEPLDSPKLLFNRELAWVDFNWRVLHQALDDRTPLLERLFFLGITASNLDEFVQKRVGGLKRQQAAGVTALSPDGRTPEEQLRQLRAAMHVMFHKMTQSWKDLRALIRSEIGIHVHAYDELPEADKEWLHAHFMSHYFPILTPLAVDPGHPFPFMSNKSLSLAVQLKHPKRKSLHFARIKVPRGQGRWVALPRPNHYVPLEEVIAANVAHLFRGMKVLSAFPFRIIRNADIYRDEEVADDLLELISEELRERRFAPVVRIEIDARMPNDVRTMLRRELELDPSDVYDVNGTLDLTDCFELASLNFPEHRFKPWDPVVPPRLRPDDGQDRRSIFDIIRSKSILVHHPYESFHASVQRFVEDAADDPRVLAIKQTLYRTSEDSPIVQALMRAADNGKQVAVLVEVKARFDEQKNIVWGQMLEASGVHVTYGLVGLKTHSKVTLVIREEDTGLHVYCHIGTGNYHATTAKLYTDVGLLTADPEIGFDAINLFHYLTGFAPEQEYRRLVVAPRDMRRHFVELIRKEVEHQETNRNGFIMAKMNALDDQEMIKELYQASQAGVQIDLIVRGHCRLRPGIPGISDNIRVISILGRFLEHSRIYYFHNNDEPLVYISSGDWQRRNLDDRVEANVAIEDNKAKRHLIRTLRLAVADHRSAWELGRGGHYVQRRPRTSEEEEGFQEKLMRLAKSRKGWSKSSGV